MRDLTVHTGELSTEERHERAKKAFLLIEQVRMAGYATAMALKQLRDDRAEEILGYETFDEFCEAEIPFLKPKQISQYLLIADTYGDRLSVEKIKELMSRRNGTHLMIEVAEEIKLRGIEPNSLSEEDLEDIIRRQNKNIKKLEKTASQKDQIIIMKDAEIKRRTEMLETIEEDYRQKIDALAKGQPLPERNRETKKLIMELMSSVTQIQSELVSIPAEERDTELVNLALMSIGVFRNMANQISDAWNNDLHDAEISSSRDPKFDVDLKELED